MTFRKQKSSQAKRDKPHTKRDWIPTVNKFLDVAKLALAAFLLLYAYFEAKQQKAVEVVTPAVIEKPPIVEPPPPKVEKPEQAKRPTHRRRQSRKPNRQGNDARLPDPR